MFYLSLDRSNCVNSSNWVIFFFKTIVFFAEWCFISVRVLCVFFACFLHVLCVFATLGDHLWFSNVFTSVLRQAGFSTKCLTTNMCLGSNEREMVRGRLGRVTTASSPQSSSGVCGLLLLLLLLQHIRPCPVPVGVVRLWIWWFVLRAL